MHNFFKSIIDLFIYIFDPEQTSEPNKISKIDIKQVPPSPIEGDLYDLSRKLVKDLKLSILFLSHIMYHDDNKLTKAEKNTIKTLLEEKKYYLEESDKIELDSFINNKPSLGFVVDYVKENDYDFKEVERLILLTIIITERDPKYERVIDNLEKKLIIEMDY